MEIDPADFGICQVPDDLIEIRLARASRSRWIGVQIGQLAGVRLGGRSVAAGRRGAEVLGRVRRMHRRTRPRCRGAGDETVQPGINPYLGVEYRW